MPDFCSSPAGTRDAGIKRGTENLGGVPGLVRPPDERQNRFKRAMLRAPDEKRMLGNAITDVVKDAVSNNWSIYFGPGTTVYTLYDALLESLPDLVDYERIGTSNHTLAPKLPLGSRQVGDRVLSEFPSLYYEVPESFPREITFDLAIIGVASIVPQRKGKLQFRTCWQEQCDTVRSVALNARHTVVLVADYYKLTHSQGNPFLSFDMIKGKLQRIRREEEICVRCLWYPRRLEHRFPESQ